MHALLDCAVPVGLLHGGEGGRVEESVGERSVRGAVGRRVETLLEAGVERKGAGGATFEGRQDLNFLCHVIPGGLQPVEHATADGLRGRLLRVGAHKDAPARSLLQRGRRGGRAAQRCRRVEDAKVVREAASVDELRVAGNVARRILTKHCGQLDTWHARTAQQVVQHGARTDGGQLVVVADEQDVRRWRESMEERTCGGVEAPW